MEETQAKVWASSHHVYETPITFPLAFVLGVFFRNKQAEDTEMNKQKM